MCNEDIPNVFMQFYSERNKQFCAAHRLQYFCRVGNVCWMGTTSVLELEIVPDVNITKHRVRERKDEGNITQSLSKYIFMCINYHAELMLLSNYLRCASMCASSHNVNQLLKSSSVIRLLSKTETYSFKREKLLEFSTWNATSLMGALTWRTTKTLEASKSEPVMISKKSNPMALLLTLKLGNQHIVKAKMILKKNLILQTLSSS